MPRRASRRGSPLLALLLACAAPRARAGGPAFLSLAVQSTGLCLVSPDAFPCPGGAGNSCPVYLGACASPAANWSFDVEPGHLVSGFECAGGGCGLNVDCDATAAGAVVKLAAGVPRAAVAFDARAGQLAYTARNGLVRCLTGGLARAPTPPCWVGETFVAAQITIDDCASNATRGWRAAAPGAR